MLGTLLADGDISMEEGTYVKKVPAQLLVSLEDAVKTFAETVSKGYTGDEIKLLETYASLLGGRIEHETYPSLAAFLKAHLQGRTALAMLEGEPVELHRGFIYVLPRCLYAATVAKYARVDGKLLNTFQKIVEAYNQNRNPVTPIVNPFCIFHDKLRQLYLDKVEFGGRKLKFFVVARKSPWDPKKSVLNEVLVKKLRKPIRKALEEIMSRYYSCCCFIPKKKTGKEALVVQ